MKRIILILILIYAGALLGQTNVLILEKIRNGKQKILPANTNIKIVTNDGNKYKGAFQVADNKTIIMGADSIKISEIKKIRFKSKFGSYIGVSVGILGGLLTTGGAAIIVQSLTEGGIAGLVGIIFGVPIATVGGLIVTTGVLVATIGRQYKPSKWTYKPAPPNN